MRVITGTQRGRKLLSPRDEAIRPTSDRVKEALFTIVQFDVPGRRVLDLFAGTGQLGIEALSRGAAQCVFVDSSPEALALVRKNLDLCHLQAPVIRADALSFLERCGKFDMLFVDPPYQGGLYNPVLEKVFWFDICSEGGIIAVECPREVVLPPAPSPYEKGRTYHYGKTSLNLYRRQ